MPYKDSDGHLDVPLEIDDDDDDDEDDDNDDDDDDDDDDEGLEYDEFATVKIQLIPFA